jgi:hypothetical protein
MRVALIAALMIALCCAPVSAQSRAGMSMHPAAPGQSRHFGRNGGRSLIGLSGVPFDREGHHRGFGRNSLFYGGYPYFPPEYDESYEPEVYAQPRMPVVVSSPPVQQEPVPSAALLELHGNEWVKVTSFSMPNVPAATTGVSTAAKELPPAILVYRDGHSEELNSYSIIGTTIFAKADYIATGSSTRKIQIANLDLPATIKQNRDRGVKFDLPSGPDEIILRP